MTLFHRRQGIFEIWSARGREIVAQTNRERRNKGLFEFIARQVIGSYQPGFFPFPIFPRLVKFDSPDILPTGIKRKPPR